MKKWYQIVCHCETRCGGMYNEVTGSWGWGTEGKRFRTIYPTKAAAEKAMKALNRGIEHVEVAT